MKRTFFKTADGSLTIQLPEWNEQYHSKHGALQEANHVFIKTGLEYFTQGRKNSPVRILEIGFGTGLNAFLTYLFAEKHKIHIHYTGIEAYPVIKEEYSQLNYASLLKERKEKFLQLHTTPWEITTAISTYFSLQKQQLFFKDISYTNHFDLVYFDAFGARVQPELWTELIFEKMFKALDNKGVLVTYAAKGSVRRAMQTVGFNVERLPGPPGKREMLRATKV